MKQQKLSGYTPNYPKKLIKSAALTAAAALLAVGTAGCAVRTAGAPMLEDPTPGAEETCKPEEILLDGDVMIEEPDDLLLGGEPLPEPTPEEHTREGEEPMLMGKIAVPDDMP